MLSLGILILRLGVGLTLAAHGAQKLFGWFEGPRIQGFSGMLESMGIRPSRPWAILAGVSEFAGGLLVAFGLLSPIGNLMAIGAMAVAIISVHASKGFFNSNGGYEFPLLILLAMLGLAFSGPGRYSLDNLLGVRLPEPATAIVFGLLTLGGIVATLASKRGMLFYPRESRGPSLG